jgi:hypothetical protein
MASDNSALLPGAEVGLIVAARALGGTVHLMATCHCCCIKADLVLLWP